MTESEIKLAREAIQAYAVKHGLWYGEQFFGYELINWQTNSSCPQVAAMQCRGKKSFMRYIRPAIREATLKTSVSFMKEDGTWFAIFWDYKDWQNDHTK